MKKYTSREKLTAVKNVVWPPVYSVITAVPYVLAFLAPGAITCAICLWMDMPLEDVLGWAFGIYIILFFMLGTLAMAIGAVEKFTAATFKKLLEARAEKGLYRVYIEHAPGSEGMDGWENGPGEYVWARQVDADAYILEEEPLSRDYSIGDAVHPRGFDRVVAMNEAVD